jgi:hypothetical protein
MGPPIIPAQQLWIRLTHGGGWVKSKPGGRVGNGFVVSGSVVALA